jgi:hypothetical protein
MEQAASATMRPSYIRAEDRERTSFLPARIDEYVVRPFYRDTKAARELSRAACAMNCRDGGCPVPFVDCAKSNEAE